MCPKEDASSVFESDSENTGFEIPVALAVFCYRTEGIQ